MSPAPVTPEPRDWQCDSCRLLWQTYLDTEQRLSRLVRLVERMRVGQQKHQQAGATQPWLEVQDMERDVDRAVLGILGPPAGDCVVHTGTEEEL